MTDFVDTNDVDITNYFGVGSNGTDIFLLGRVSQRMTRDEALVLAAWIVALADESIFGDRFLAILKRVQDT